jgi:hypothetical protein
MLVSWVSVLPLVPDRLQADSLNSVDRQKALCPNKKWAVDIQTGIPVPAAAVYDQWCGSYEIVGRGEGDRRGR